MEVERTGTTKSYKMVVLRYMLSKGTDYWLDPITSQETATFFHEYLTVKDYRLNTDFSNELGKKLRVYNEKAVADLIARMPMTKWSGSAKDGLDSFEEEIFNLNLKIGEVENEVLYFWTREISEQRMHSYFGRKGSGSSLTDLQI